MHNSRMSALCQRRDLLVYAGASMQKGSEQTKSADQLPNTKLCISPLLYASTGLLQSQTEGVGIESVLRESIRRSCGYYEYSSLVDDYVQLAIRTRRASKTAGSICAAKVADTGSTRGL